MLPGSLQEGLPDSICWRTTGPIDGVPVASWVLGGHVDSGMQGRAIALDGGVEWLSD